jgi:hypothetical protein
MAAGDRFPVIALIDLLRVWGGSDKQTRAVELAIARATSEVESLAKAVAPKPSIVPMLLQMMNHRRPGPGPTPAPALPPTSTLTR